MPTVLALLSSLLWGTADFLGGTAARRLPVRTVVTGSQATALLLLVPTALLVGEVPSSPWQGLLAGAVGAIGLGAFYAALAAGTMGVVAPVAATGVAVPVLVGLVRGESPHAVQVMGIVVALVGVVLASGPELSGAASARPLALALVAALAFGSVLVLIADASTGSAGSVVVTLLLMRLASVSLGSAAVLVRTRPTQRRAVGSGLLLFAAIGVADLTANACYAFASRGGLLSVVAVLSSLYPVITVLLARQLHGERLLRVQVVGAVGTLLGVVLLSAV